MQRKNSAPGLIKILPVIKLTGLTSFQTPLSQLIKRRGLHVYSSGLIITTIKKSLFNTQENTSEFNYKNAGLKNKREL